MVNGQLQRRDRAFILCRLKGIVLYVLLTPSDSNLRPSHFSVEYGFARWTLHKLELEQFDEGDADFAEGRKLLLFINSDDTPYGAAIHGLF